MCQSNTQMLMDIIGMGLFDQNMSIACAKARLRNSWISLISQIDLFDQNVLLTWI